jgi:twitching motility protein PilT
MVLPTIDQLLRLLPALNASDLHLKAGSRPIIRLDGQLRPLAEFAPLTSDVVTAFLSSLVSGTQYERFQQELELDFAVGRSGVGRFRVNAAWQRGTVCLAIRYVKSSIPTLAILALPEICGHLAERAHGLVLVTGPTGSGKSTTLAAMLDHINQRRRCHIVTIEDPIEYLYSDERAFITQRELGGDTRSFASALRHALRQDPDVIMVGELRDLETIQLAITAAETGHLVLGTLHTSGAAASVDRLIDVFPAGQQAQIRHQVAATLEGVIAQLLLPSASGSGRVALAEVMVATDATRALIRDGKTHQLGAAIATGAGLGMQTLEQALAEAVASGRIMLETAQAVTTHPADLQQRLATLNGQGRQWR